jgi:hypothetical protein
MTTPSSLCVLLAPSATLARTVLETEPVALTVEAEYGAYVAEGSLYTAAHHQPLGSPYAGTHVGGPRSSPCNDEAIPTLTEGVILVSHLDLDTFGGCFRALAEFGDLFPSNHEGPLNAFWALAEFIDVRGAHKRGLAHAEGFSMFTLGQLDSWWAWNKANTPRLSRDVVSDVTPLVHAAGEAIRRIFAGEEGMRLAGVAFRGGEDRLNERTFVMTQKGVLVRTAASARDFCNHLYSTPHAHEVLYKAVACLNTETGSVMISLADPVEGVSCRQIVQALWGSEAGGHDGIAGSPRERIMGMDDLQAVVDALASALSPA